MDVDGNENNLLTVPASAGRRRVSGKVLNEQGLVDAENRYSSPPELADVGSDAAERLVRNNSAVSKLTLLSVNKS